MRTPLKIMGCLRVSYNQFKKIGTKPPEREIIPRLGIYT